MSQLFDLLELWDSGYYGSLWVHPITVINIPPGYGNISNNFQNTEVEVVPITVSQSGHLVGVIYRLLNSGDQSDFSVSVMNGSTTPIEFFTDPTISVVGNEI